MQNDEWDDSSASTVPAMSYEPSIPQMKAQLNVANSANPRAFLQSQISALQQPQNQNSSYVDNLINSVKSQFNTLAQIPTNIKNFVQDPVGYTKNLPVPTPEQIALSFSGSGLGGAEMGMAGMMKPKGGNFMKDLADMTYSPEYIVSGTKNLGAHGELGQHIEALKDWGSGDRSPGRLDNKGMDTWHNWVQGPYMNYITKQLGTGVKTDPLVKLAEEENIHIGKKPDEEITDLLENDADINRITNNGSVTTTTPTGRNVENASDTMLDAIPAHIVDSYLKRKGADEFTDYPYLSKLDPDTPIYDLVQNNTAFETLGLDQIAQRVFDGIHDGTITKENYTKHPVETVARMLHKEENSGFAKLNRDPVAYAKWRQDEHYKLPANISYADGSKMIKFDKEFFDKDPEYATRQMSVDTKDLNHCMGSCSHGVGDYPNRFVPMVEPHTGMMPNKIKNNQLGHGRRYADDLRNGEAEYFSLRGPNGEAKATIETGKAPDSADVLFKRYTETLPEDQKKNLLQAYMHAPDSRDFIVDLHNNNSAFSNFMQQAPLKGGRYDIRQLAGKENKQINDEDIPAMKQWLNTTPIRNVDTLALRLSRLYDSNSTSSIDRFMIDHPHLENRFTDAVEEAKREKIMEWSHDLAGDIEDLGGNWDMDEQGFPYENILNQEPQLFNAEAQTAGLTVQQARNLYKKYNKLFNQPFNNFVKDHVPRFFDNKDIEKFIDSFGY